MNLLSVKKKRMIVAVVLVLVAVLLVLLSADLRSKGKYRAALTQRQEMAVLAEQYGVMRSHVDRVEHRIGLSKAESITIAVENLFGGMGLKRNLKSVKPFGGGTSEQYEIQEAEITVDKLTLNELVNVLHAVYTVPAGLFVTSAEFKRDFSERSRINARISLKLIGRKPEVKS
ncbi:MAG: hypothetical protein ACM34I_04285 [bacterium]